MGSGVSGGNDGARALFDRGIAAACWHLTITLPWEVPPETVIVEYDEGVWRVVPHRGATRIFETREEALTWARMVAALFPTIWQVVEKPPARDVRRRPA